LDSSVPFGQQNLLAYQTAKFNPMIDYNFDEIILAIQAAALAGDYRLAYELRGSLPMPLCIHCAITLEDPEDRLCMACFFDLKIWRAVHYTTNLI
jgi:hypothetical protein